MKPQNDPANIFLFTIVPAQSDGVTHAEVKHVSVPTTLGWLAARRRVGWRR